MRAPKPAAAPPICGRLNTSGPRVGGRAAAAAAGGGVAWGQVEFVFCDKTGAAPAGLALIVAGVLLVRGRG